MMVMKNESTNTTQFASDSCIIYRVSSFHHKLDIYFIEKIIERLLSILLL